MLGPCTPPPSSSPSPVTPRPFLSPVPPTAAKGSFAAWWSSAEARRRARCRRPPEPRLPSCCARAPVTPPARPIFPHDQPRRRSSPTVRRRRSSSSATSRRRTRSISPKRAGASRFRSSPNGSALRLAEKAPAIHAPHSSPVTASDGPPGTVSTDATASRSPHSMQGRSNSGAVVRSTLLVSAGQTLKSHFRGRPGETHRFGAPRPLPYL